MSLDEQTVRGVARLARLALSDDEIARMTEELGSIVDYVEQLAEVDTSAVEPIAQVTGLVNVSRDDVAGAMDDPASALANAPHATDAAFLVPKAVER